MKAAGLAGGRRQAVLLIVPALALARALDALGVIDRELGLVKAGGRDLLVLAGGTTKQLHRIGMTPFWFAVLALMAGLTLLRLLGVRTRRQLSDYAKRALLARLSAGRTRKEALHS